MVLTITVFNRFFWMLFSWTVIVHSFLSTPTCDGLGLDSYVGLLSNLKKAYPSWSPRAILDIGANKGTWSTNARSVYPESKILMLEASDQHNTSLGKTVDSIGNAKYRIGVISDHDGDVIPFYFNPDASTGNSMFREQTRFFTNVKPENKIATTLDTIVKEEEETFLQGETSSNVFDIIKIDVQGAELSVLRGGLKTLKLATFIQIEGSAVEYNAGGSCLYETDEFLRSIGFYYYDHSDDLRNHALFKTYGLGQWDILYVNPDSENVPTKLKEKAPRFCGSSPEKKKESKNANSYHVMDSSISYPDMNKLMDYKNNFFTWVFGMISGLFLGKFVPVIYKFLTRKIKSRYN